MASDHEKLGEILIAIKEMELAKFAQIASHKQSLLNRLEALETARSTARQTAADAMSIQLSNILSSDEKWIRWVEIERQKLGHQLARLAAQEEEQRLSSATALGKVNAFEKITEKLKVARRNRGP